MVKFDLKTRMSLAVSLLFVLFATLLAIYNLYAVDRDTRTLWLVTSCTTLAVLVVVWLMINYLMAPLTTITRHVEKLPEKTGDERFMNAGCVNEIGTLAEAFNGMLQALDSKNEALLESENNFKILAQHDSLTELPNRLLCFDRLRQAMARARRSGEMVALLCIDLDRFKNVNDSLGHEAGDVLLKEVSQRFRYWVRASDTVARLGGDEFVIILEQMDDAKYAAVVAQKLISVLDQPVVVNGNELFVTISIGIAIFPSDDAEVEGLMKCADIAMYSAKEKGRNNYQFYTADMNSRASEILMIQGELHRALELEQLMLYYQPQLDLKSGGLVGMEALIRWLHPIKGLVPPDSFIPQAEENGMIVPVGEWVLNCACRQNKAWQDKGYTSFRMAVNISPRQFRNGDLVAVVARALERSGLEPCWLELEITESLIMWNVEAAVGTMRELSEMGVLLAIDDFGTGYSSLAHLKRFPINRLKIDKSFVREIAGNANDAAIASAIIALSHSMGLEVIAEGIETDESLNLLRELGCELGQGYFFSRPQPPALLHSFLPTRR